MSYYWITPISYQRSQALSRLGFRFRRSEEISESVSSMGMVTALVGLGLLYVPEQA